MKRDLAQLVVFLAWFALLVRYIPLRRLMLSATRPQQILAAALLAAWTTAQVLVVPSAWFPIVSVHMYGEWSPTPATSVVRTMGEYCDGTRRAVDVRGVSGARIRGRIGRMYLDLDHARDAADTARRLALIDGSLLAVARQHNRQFPDQPLCGLSLDVTTVRAEEIGTGRLPDPIASYRVDVR